MRRRCCCSDITPHDCFRFWDYLGGASDRPGSTITFNWSGGVRWHNATPTQTFAQNPNIYPTFDAGLLSGSVELDYIGNIFQTCVWHGEHSRTIHFPHITIPDDWKADGTGKYEFCPTTHFSKSFSSVSLVHVYRFVLSENSWPYFISYIMLESVRDYYDPLSGNWSINPASDQDDLIYLPVDSTTCASRSCTGFDQFGEPTATGRIRFSTQSSLLIQTGFAAGQGNIMVDGPGFFVGTIPPRDIDIPNHKLRVGLGLSGLITRYMCLYLGILGGSQNCNDTLCSGVTFSWGMRSPDSSDVLPNPVQGYLEW